MVIVVKQTLKWCHQLWILQFIVQTDRSWRWNSHQGIMSGLETITPHETSSSTCQHHQSAVPAYFISFHRDLGTLTFDPSSEAFISATKCINAVNMVRLYRIWQFQIQSEPDPAVFGTQIWPQPDPDLGRTSFWDETTILLIKQIASKMLSAAVKRQYSSVFPLLHHCLTVLGEICRTAINFVFSNTK